MTATADPAAETPAAPASRRLVFAALLLVMLLASLDQTIVSTALPTIVGELGGLDHLSWIVTAYMLATTVVTPLYGKLGDLFGRKVVLQVAVVLFLAGSALCGLAGSMGELIVYRALQGLGGGGLMVVSMAVVGDIIPPRERGRYQGYFGAVFGLSTVLGPLLGGFFVEQLSWRWIFYVNLPLGGLAILVLGLALPARQRLAERPRIDYGGAALLALTLVLVVLATSLGGQTLAWDSPAILGMAAAALVALLALLLVEWRAPQAILPPRLFANRTFWVAAAVGFVVGLALFGSVTYLPLYLQVVKGESAADAGLQLTPMMGGVLLSSIASGQIIARTGRYRIFPICGTAVMTLGLLLLSRLDAASSPWLASGYALVLGLGLGLVMQVLVMAAQNAVDYRDLGVATSGVTLFRSIGGSVGVALFGAIFAAGLSLRLATGLGGAEGGALPDPATIAALPAPTRDAYRAAFSEALQPVFLAAAAIAACAVLLALLLRELPLRATARETLAESLLLPRDARSLEELERIVTAMTRHENRWEVYRRSAEGAGLDLSPDGLWLLVQLARREPVRDTGALARHFAAAPERLSALLETLVERGLARHDAGETYVPTAQGLAAFERVAVRYRTHLEEMLARWKPREHAEVEAMLARMARALVAEPPPRPATGRA